jgi:hypothetical protein
MLNSSKRCRTRPPRIRGRRHSPLVQPRTVPSLPDPASRCAHFPNGNAARSRVSGPLELVALANLEDLANHLRYRGPQSVAACQLVHGGSSDELSHASLTTTAH